MANKHDDNEIDCETLQRLTFLSSLFKYQFLIRYEGLHAQYISDRRDESQFSMTQQFKIENSNFQNTKTSSACCIWFGYGLEFRWRETFS